MPESIHARALRQAAKVLGGYENLQRKLQVPASSLFPWLNGVEPIPERVFLQVVDIIAGNPEDSTGLILPPEVAGGKQDTQNGS